MTDTPKRHDEQAEEFLDWFFKEVIEALPPIDPQATMPIGPKNLQAVEEFLAEKHGWPK